MSAFPAITDAEASPSRVWLSRLAWTLSGAVAWVVVGLSAWLHPSAQGFGTHEQLGLPPCAFQAQTGIPCPGCGLTTSFANMAHLHLLAAFKAHLMGPLLFLLTVGVAVTAPWMIRRKITVAHVLEQPATSAALGVTLAAGLVTFALRLVAMR